MKTAVTKSELVTSLIAFCSLFSKIARSESRFMYVQYQEHNSPFPQCYYGFA
jgi:hypothetical protein